MDVVWICLSSLPTSLRARFVESQLVLWSITTLSCVSLLFDPYTDRWSCYCKPGTRLQTRFSADQCCSNSTARLPSRTATPLILSISITICTARLDPNPHSLPTFYYIITLLPTAQVCDDRQKCARFLSESEAWRYVCPHAYGGYRSCYGLSTTGLCEQTVGSRAELLYVRYLRAFCNFIERVGLRLRLSCLI